MITGGEPLEHDLNQLCKTLKEKTSTHTGSHLPIHIETSGVYNASGEFDWITLSPKKHLPPKEEILQICHEIKVIIHEKEDITFAQEMAKQANNRRKLASSTTSTMKKKDRRLIAVVSGFPTKKLRSVESLKLLNWGYRNTNTFEVSKKDETIFELETWLGRNKKIKAKTNEDYYITINNNI